MKDISYLCSTDETVAIQARIQLWIAARQVEGWSVEFKIRQDGDQTGVMWQCIVNSDGRYREFSPCISMNGREFSSN